MGAWSCSGLILLLKNDLRYEFRAGTALFIVYIFGMVVSYNSSILSGGPTWLFSFSVLASLLLGLKPALFAVLLNLISLLFLTWLKWKEPTPISQYYFDNYLRIAVALFTFITLNTATVITIGALLRRLERLHLRELKALSLLKAEKREIVETNRLLTGEVGERKRIEGNLRNSEERFRQLVDLLPETVYEMDLEGRLSFLNQAGYKAFGCTSEDIKAGVNIFDRLPPEKVSPAGKSFRTRRGRAGKGGAEYSVLRKDGSGFEARIYNAPIYRDGRPRGFRGILIDITERRKAEQGLRISEKRYRDLFNSITDLIYTQDLEGRFLSINRAVSKTMDYEPAEMIGHKAAEFMKREHRTFYDSLYLKEVVEQGYLEGTTAFYTRKGQIVYIEYNSVLVRPESEEAYISGMGRDVTARILAQNELRRLEEQLSQSQKMEAVGTLASGVAHEFNNILQAISGFAQIMLLEPGDEPANRKHLEQIEEVMDGAAELVRRLLSFGRKSDLATVQLDLNRQIGRYVPLLERIIPRMITVQTRLDSHLGTILADHIQIEQILVNMAINARDAMPDGGRLLIETSALKIASQKDQKRYSLPPGEYAGLIISDNGVGIAPEIKKRIFEPFFTTKEEGQGTGLGLSTVSDIVHKLNGSIACRSSLGEGTGFEIYLPVACRKKADKPLSLKSKIGRDSIKGSETILVVDDERPFWPRFGSF